MELVPHYEELSFRMLCDKFVTVMSIMEKLTSEDLRRMDAFLDFADARLKSEDARININPLAVYLGVMVGYCRRLVSQLTPEGVTHTHEFTEESVTGPGQRCGICLMPERVEQQRVPYDKRWTGSSPPLETIVYPDMEINVTGSYTLTKEEIACSVDWAELSRHKKTCPIRRGEKGCSC